MHTKLMQRVAKDGAPPKLSGFNFPFGKSKAVNLLKKQIPFPSVFFYELKKKGIASFYEPINKETVTIQILEFDPKAPSSEEPK